MALVAQIKFSQGANVGLPGRALEGSLGTVTVENGDDTDVVEWAWSMLDVPEGSGVALGAFGGNNPTATFTADVDGGSYRVRLLTKNAGGDELEDVRNFLVPDDAGAALPSFQPVSGVNYTQAEYNVGGQPRSWAQLKNVAHRRLRQYARPDTFYFAPSAPARSGNLLKDFAELQRILEALPAGVSPKVVFLEDWTFSAVGMPPNGWWFGSGEVSAPRDVVLTVPDGVKLNGLRAIRRSVLMLVAPTTEYSVFQWVHPTIDPSAKRIIEVTDDAELANVGTRACWIGPGTGVECRLVCSRGGSTRGSTAPILKVTADSVTAAHVNCGSSGGLSDGWLVGSGGRPTVDEDSTSPTPDITPGISPVIYPGGWTGLAPTTRRGDRSTHVLYDDAVRAPAVGATAVQGAIDELKTRASVARTRSVLSGVAATQEDATNPLVVGALHWDTARNYGQLVPGSSVKLRAVLSTTNAANGVRVDVRRTTGAGSPAIVGTTTVFTGTAPDEVELDLTAVLGLSGSGLTGVYQVRMYLQTNNAVDYAVCHGAWMEIE